MALPDSEWLDRAKRLPVGMRMRVQHRNERRHNLTIGNERDRWWAYCQACKDGGRIEKEHVLLGPALADMPEPSRDPPTDRVRVVGSDYEAAVGRFLASKGMMFPYLPELWVSPSERRVMLFDGAHWHGRDITERSHAKWMHWNSKFSGIAAPITVLTEDLFSMYKVRFALREFAPSVAVCCTLGAIAGHAAVLALKSCDTLVWAYDGDHAGDAGFKQAQQRMRPFVRRQVRARPPEGKDPKDMDSQAIRDMIEGALQ